MRPLAAMMAETRKAEPMASSDVNFGFRLQSLPSSVIRINDPRFPAPQRDADPTQLEYVRHYEACTSSTMPAFSQTRRWQSPEEIS